MDLERAFEDISYPFADAEALAQCKLVAEEHRLKPSDVASNYEAFAASKDFPMSVSVHHLAAFTKHLVATLAGNARFKQAASVKPRIFAQAYDVQQDFLTPNPKRQAFGNGAVPKTGPSPQGTSAAVRQLGGATPPVSPGATQFASRQNKGQVVSTLNDKLAMPSKTQVSASVGLPSLQLLGEQLVVPGVQHLHMIDTVETKVHAMNERILSFGEAIRQAVPEAADINQTSVAEVSQEPVWVVGRVVAESDTGVLNEQSVLLEGSREASGGARVRLDLSHVPSFRLFPGQVLGARGLNPTGNVFMAQQLITHCPLGRPASAPGASAAEGVAASRGLSMVVAAGPFTTSDNLHYEPLEELLAYCSSNHVDQVLLLGPFVDAEHPLVRDGTLNATYEQVFVEEVNKKLAIWQQQDKNQSCRVLLVPSVRDVHMSPVFPQPPLSLGGANERLCTLQNPCSFISEGLAVAASSQDVLMHLSGCEVSRGQQGQDSLTARASHVIGQRSLYPVFPAPLGSCLDTAHNSSLQLPGTPDLLLLPSNLTAFAKTLSLAPGQLQGAPAASTSNAPQALVVVNPGRLAKGVSGGTFAHVYAAPVEAADSAGSQGTLHQLRVDIRRI